MIVLKIDRVKRRVRLIPESSVDLLNLYRVVDVGDVIYSETTREIKRERAYGPADSERIRVRIGLRLENKAADPLMRRVSFLGVILYASEELDILKKHHTIHVERGRAIEIESRDRFPQLLAIARASRRGKKRSLLCISVDDEVLSLAQISEAGVRVIKTTRHSGAGKMGNYSSVINQEEVVREIADHASRVMEQSEGVEVVLIGPAVASDMFLRLLRRVSPDLHRAVKRRVNVSSGGEEGIREALRRGALGEDFKPLKDAMIVEEVIERASMMPERVAMGLAEVSASVGKRQARSVIVSEDYVWSNLADERLATILSEAEGGGVDLRIVLSETEAAEKINAFGGIIALR